MGRPTAVLRESSRHESRLDWLRAAGAVLVVALHAGIPYLTHPMPGLVWLIDPEPAAEWVNALVWAIEGFVMPLFLAVSGYGAGLSLKSKSVGEFLQSRWRRLGRPLLVVGLILLPLELYLWLGSWVLQGRIPAAKLRSLKLAPPYDGVWGYCHLWYLEYILLYSLMAAAVAGMARWRTRKPLASDDLDAWPSTIPLNAAADSSPRSISFGWIASLGLAAVASAAVLTTHPEPVLGFQHAFFPVPAKFAYSGVFFALGLIWAYSPRWQPTSMSLGAMTFAASAAVFACSYSSQMDYLSTGHIHPSLGWALALFAAGSTCSLWAITGNLSSPCPQYVVRMARASFWVYLAHHPLVAACHALMLTVPIDPAMKFAVSAVAAWTGAYASYWLWIDGRSIGHFLEGRDDGHDRTAPTAPVFTPAAVSGRRAA